MRAVTPVSYAERGSGWAGRSPSLPPMMLLRVIFRCYAVIDSGLTWSQQPLKESMTNARLSSPTTPSTKDGGRW